MGSLSIESMREDSPGKSDHEAAEAFARKHDYIVIVRYKVRGASDFTNIGACTSESEIEGYMTSPYCSDVEIIYDGRSSALRITDEMILSGRCEGCGKRATRGSLTLMAGNDFYICPKCGFMACSGCYIQLPLASSPGYGMCPKCRVVMQRAIPGFYGGQSGGYSPDKQSDQSKAKQATGRDNRAQSSQSVDTMTDIDGNVYRAVKIGNQIWMAENLKVTHYRNGDPIPQLKSDSMAKFIIAGLTDVLANQKESEWKYLKTGIHCVYDNSERIDGHVATFGRLYNWYVVNDSRDIAPNGWHVPSDADWQTLIDYLGGNKLAGGKMKDSGISFWVSPNTGATNESSFSARPGGTRSYSSGNYVNLGQVAYFWSTVENDSNHISYQTLSFKHAGIYNSLDSGQEYRRYCFSVRCVKD
jgi:uncharacterized protein (TIGR02145 family)